MRIECTDANGFEDQLTTGRFYWALESKNGGYLVTSNDGKQRWYGSCKFRPTFSE